MQAALVADLAATRVAAALGQLGDSGAEAGAAQPLGPEWVATVEEATWPATRVNRPHA
jgi:hypothetical protein